MNVYAVEYSYVPAPTSLDQHRPGHRAFLRSLMPEFLVVAGAYQSGETPGALLVVRAPDTSQVEQTLDADPFMTEGLIAQRTIRLWNPAIGSI